MSASKSWSYITLNDFSQKSLPNLSFRIVTKLQLQYFDQTLASILRPNFSFKMSPNLNLQNLDQTLALKPWLNFSFNESTNIRSKMSTQWWTGKEMRGSFHWALTEKIRATEVLILSREDIKYYLAIFYLRTKFCIYCLPLKFISILLDSTETSVTIANKTAPTFSRSRWCEVWFENFAHHYKYTCSFFITFTSIINYL